MGWNKERSEAQGLKTRMNGGIVHLPGWCWAGAVQGVNLPRTKLPGTCLCRAALPPSRRNPRLPPVLRLKIRLLEVSPMIWRRVLVPASYALEELHGVIQVAMGRQSLHRPYGGSSGRGFGYPLGLLLEPKGPRHATDWKSDAFDRRSRLR